MKKIVSIRFRWRVVGEVNGKVISMLITEKFQSAFAGEWLERVPITISAIPWRPVSIRFRWRVVGEKRHLRSDCQAFQVSIRFRWRVVGEGDAHGFCSKLPYRFNPLSLESGWRGYRHQSGRSGI